MRVRLFRVWVLYAEFPRSLVQVVPIRVVTCDSAQTASTEDCRIVHAARKRVVAASEYDCVVPCSLEAVLPSPTDKPMVTRRRFPGRSEASD